jgi:hypothetical protein
MTETKCDICGVKVEAGTTVPLREQYQTGGMKDICGNCETTINKAHEKMTAVLMRMRDGWVCSVLRMLRNKLRGGS